MLIHMTYILLAIGFVFLIKGADFLVDGSSALARRFGISDLVIGLTVVALGTSLPELATSATAAYKGNADIAIGNVVGSNIFNIFFILGLSTILRPLPFAEGLTFDVWVCVGVSALLFVWMFLGRRYMLGRWQGWACIGLYALYISAIIMRG